MWCRLCLPTGLRTLSTVDNVANHCSRYWMSVKWNLKQWNLRWVWTLRHCRIPFSCQRLLNYLWKVKVYGLSCDSSSLSTHGEQDFESSWKHILQGVSMSIFPEGFNWREKVHLECGQLSSMGPDTDEIQRRKWCEPQHPFLFQDYGRHVTTCLKAPVTAPSQTWWIVPTDCEPT